MNGDKVPGRTPHPRNETLSYSHWKGARTQWDKDFESWEAANDFFHQMAALDCVIAALRWSRARSKWVVDIDEPAPSMIINGPVEGSIDALLEEDVIGDAQRRAEALRLDADKTYLVRIDAKELQRLQIADRIWHSCPSATVPELLKAVAEVVKVVQG